MKAKLGVLIAGMAVVGLVGCSESVDREGSRDNIVEEAEAAGFTLDPDCVDEVLDKYSDDELKEYSDDLEENGLEASEAAMTYSSEILACADGG